MILPHKINTYNIKRYKLMHKNQRKILWRTSTLQWVLLTMPLTLGCFYQRCSANLAIDKLYNCNEIYIDTNDAFSFLFKRSVCVIFLNSLKDDTAWLHISQDCIGNLSRHAGWMNWRQHSVVQPGISVSTGSSHPGQIGRDWIKRNLGEWINERTGPTGWIYWNIPVRPACAH